MPPHRPTRRTILKLAGAGLLGTTAIDTAAADNAPFRTQLRTVANATRRYTDLERALANGFRIMGPYAPDMGYHIVHPGRIERAARAGINIRHPQALTYNLDGTLGSVEYIVPATQAKPDIFNDPDDLAVAEAHGWHPHPGAQHVFSNGDDTVDDPDDLSIAELLNPDNWAELMDEAPMFPPEVPGLAAGDTLSVNWGHQPGDAPEERLVDFVVEHDDWWTLHAWIHFENPDGLFSPMNHASDWDPLGGGHDH